MSTRKTLSGALLLVLQSLLLNVLSVPATAYIIRSLGPHGHGQWATAVTLVGVFTILTSLGLRPQFVRAVAQEPERVGEFLAHQLGMRAVLTVGAAALACATCLCLRYDADIFRCTLVISSGLLMTTIGSTFTDLLQGLQKVRDFALVGLISGLIVTAATVIAVWYGVGPVGLSAAYLAGPATSLVLQYAILRRLRIPVRFAWDTTRVRSLMGDSRAWTAHMLVSSVRERMEPLALPKLVGTESVSYFTAGSMLPDRLTIVPDGLASAFYPAIAREASDPQRAEREIRRLLIFSMATCLAVTVLLSYFADPIARILFPKTAEYCRYVIQVTVWALPFAGLSYAVDTGLMAVGKQSDVARAMIRSQIATAVLSVLLLVFGGLHGACWSYVLRSAAPILFVLPQFMRVFPGLLAATPLARLAVCAAAMAGLLQITLMVAVPARLQILPTAAAGSMSSLLGYGLWGAAALMMYMALLLALGVLSRSEVVALLPGRRTAGTE